MTTVICHIANCKHRSKRALKSWITKDGRPCYSCGLKKIGIRRFYDADGDIENIAGEESTVLCSSYERKD